MVGGGYRAVDVLAEVPHLDVFVEGRGGEEVRVVVRELEHVDVLLSVECWVLGVGCWVLGVGCWVLGVGCWVLGVEC